MPNATLTEQLDKLCHAKCFSLVDVREGFLHIPLDDKLSLIITMDMSCGRYCWLCLPFGISSTPEEFQKRLMSAQEGLGGGGYCASLVISSPEEGRNYQEAEKDHDCWFVALKEHCTKKNIILNQSKPEFKLKEIRFMGNIITAEGMQADPDKISAITAMA